MVSLPYSDHAEILVDRPSDLTAILNAVQQHLRQNHLRYLEIRPCEPLNLTGFRPSAKRQFCLHTLDLRRSINELFANTHKNCIQRKVRLAERSRLQYEEGRSDHLLASFYRLLVATRRRHLVPPQPLKWFRNLIDCWESDLSIRVASFDGQPAAAIMTLRHNSTAVFKYGCSDIRFHRLGSMHFLLWKAVTSARHEELSTFDLGRTDCSNEGLLTFKDRWGAKRHTLTYGRLLTVGSAGSEWSKALETRLGGLGKTVIPHLPDAVLRTLGGLFYRHMA
jgi:hypothetical protein